MRQSVTRARRIKSGSATKGGDAACFQITLGDLVLHPVGDYECVNRAINSENLSAFGEVTRPTPFQLTTCSCV